MDTPLTPTERSPLPGPEPHRPRRSAADRDSLVSPGQFRYVVTPRKEGLDAALTPSEVMLAVLKGLITADDYEIEICAAEDSDV